MPTGEDPFVRRVKEANASKPFLSRILSNLAADGAYSIDEHLADHGRIVTGRVLGTKTWRDDEPMGGDYEHTITTIEFTTADGQVVQVDGTGNRGDTVSVQYCPWSPHKLYKQLR